MAYPPRSLFAMGTIARARTLSGQAGPVQVRSSRNRKSQSIQPPSDSQAVILVVDDYTPFLEMVQATLEQEGYQVWTASGGQPALDLLLENFRKLDLVPDLIISDIMMPGIDGYAFYEQVRENPYLNHIPFIFLTAKGQCEDIRQGKELGADDYLCKPCTDEDLLAAVRGKLRRVEQRRRLNAQFRSSPSASREGQNTIVLVIGIVLILSACVLGALAAQALF